MAMFNQTLLITTLLGFHSVNKQLNYGCPFPSHINIEVIILIIPSKHFALFAWWWDWGVWSTHEWAGWFYTNPGDPGSGFQVTKRRGYTRTVGSGLSYVVDLPGQWVPGYHTSWFYPDSGFGVTIRRGLTRTAVFGSLYVVVWPRQSRFRLFVPVSWILFSRDKKKIRLKNNLIYHSKNCLISFNLCINYARIIIFS